MHHSVGGDDGEDASPPSDVRTARPGRRVLALPLFLLELFGGGALLLLMGLTVSDALLRSLANRPILGGSDLIQVTLSVVVACALPLCVAAGRAIAIDMLVDRLPERARAIVARLVAVICSGVLLALSWRCAVNAGEAAMFGETTMLLRISYGPFYLALSVSTLLCALIFLFDALRKGSAR